MRRNWVGSAVDPSRVASKGMGRGSGRRETAVEESKKETADWVTRCQTDYVGRTCLPSMLLVPQSGAAASKVLFLLCFGFPVISFCSWSYSVDVMLFVFVFICSRSHKIQVNFDPETKTKSFLTPINETKKFRSLNWNQVKFDRPHWNQVNIHHPDKTKSISMLTLKPSDFAARIQKLSQSRPSPTQKPSPSIMTLKTS